MLPLYFQHIFFCISLIPSLIMLPFSKPWVHQHSTVDRSLCRTSPCCLAAKNRELRGGTMLSSSRSAERKSWPKVACCHNTPTKHEHNEGVVVVVNFLLTSAASRSKMLPCTFCLFQVFKHCRENHSDAAGHFPLFRRLWMRTKEHTSQYR